MNNYKNDNVPSILKPMIVSRKFTVERDGRDVSLQFGSGKDGETNIVAEPQSVAIDVFGKSYTSDTTFDPSRLSKNEIAQSTENSYSILEALLGESSSPFFHNSLNPTTADAVVFGHVAEAMYEKVSSFSGLFRSKCFL